MLRPTAPAVRAACLAAILACAPLGDATAKTKSAAAAQHAPASRYTFEVLARDGQVLDRHKIVGYTPRRVNMHVNTGAFDGPVIDDRGRTAFLLEADDADVLYLDGRAVVWTGKALGGSVVQAIFKPSINAAGGVAYRARIADRDAIVLDGSVVLQSGDEIPVCGVVDTMDDPILNASGSYMVRLVTRAAKECIVVDRQAVVISYLTRIGNVAVGDVEPVGESLTRDKDVVFATADGSRQYLCTLHMCTPRRDLSIRRPKLNGAGQAIYSALRLNPGGMGGGIRVIRRDGTEADVRLDASFSTFAMNDAGHIFSSMYGELSDYRRPGRRQITPYAPQRGALYGTRAFFATYPEIRRALHLGLEKLTMVEDVSLNNRDQVAFIVNWLDTDPRSRSGTHFAVIRGSPAGLGSVPAPPPCTPCERIAAQSATPAEKAESRRLCHALYGAFAELRGYRQAFVTAPKGADLFPDAYYHVTEAAIARLAAGDFAHPIETMDQMLAFYDAYRVNRESWSKTGRAADPWWQVYYDTAAIVDRNIATASTDPHWTTQARNYLEATLWHVGDLRDQGIEAHVQYDLPRALRAAFARRFHHGLTEADLRVDFDRSDETIRIATAPASRDVAEAAMRLGPASSLTMDFWRLHQGGSTRDTADSAIRLRHDAWNRAFDPVRPLAQAPLSDHVSLERTGADACR